MLRWRLLAAAIIGSGLALLVVLDLHHPLGAPGVWLMPLALVAAGLACQEVLDLFRGHEPAPMAGPALVGTLVVVFASFLPLAGVIAGHTVSTDGAVSWLGWPLAAFWGVMVGVFGVAVARFRHSAQVTAQVALTLLVVAYVGLSVAVMVQLRLLGSSGVGMAALLSLILIVKSSDTGAYFVGRRWGRHPLAPIISPKKTIEGAVGGFVAGGLAGLACRTWLAPLWLPLEQRGPWWGWLVYGLLLTAFGMLGDLAESLLKRDAGRKDSSHWLPGLGGVLDILDSLLLASLPAYACWVLGLVGRT